MSGRRLRAAVTALTALLVMLVCAGSALAAPTVGPSGSAFYTPPSPLPSGSNGDLIWYRPATLNLGSGAPGVNAWNMLYYTTDSLGTQDLATGTLIVPTASWSGLGSRPVIDYAPGTQGLAQSCAPSSQLAAGTEYEASNIVGLLAKGWAVVVSDYQGYTTGSQSLYIDGAAEGHAVLDAAKAAGQVPGTGLSSSPPTAIWGYSQGGQAAAWAAQLAPSYDSSMSLVGVAAGGIPGDLQATADYLNGGPAAGFAAMAIVGLSDQYPSALNLATLENANGAAAVAAIKGECVFSALLQFEHANLDSYTAGGESLDSLLAQPAIASVVSAQKLGGTKITVPLYQYHGQADEIVPLAQDIALKQQYCSLGTTDEFVLYPGEHITTMTQAAVPVISWLSDRLTPLIGTLDAPNDCSESAAVPTSTAAPKAGDWLVNLKSWPLAATIHLKTLNASLNLPSSTTFSGATDLTSDQLQNGVVSAPTFSTSITALGILPLGLTVSLAQQGPASGSASLDSNGQLHINGAVRETIKMSTISFLGLNLVSSTCQTSSAVNFPLVFNGPVASLGNGNLKFSGTTTFPDLTNCGALTGILNLLVAGAGNTYTFTVSPPAPTNY